jgi:hypothetical protein
MNQKYEANFEAWMKKVDAAVGERSDLSYMDLTNQPYRDWFEDGVRPARAAVKALRAEGWRPGDRKIYHHD